MLKSNLFVKFNSLLSKTIKEIGFLFVLNIKNSSAVFLFAVVKEGTEGKFRRIYSAFDEPYLILYNEFNNSLPT